MSRLSSFLEIFGEIILAAATPLSKANWQSAMSVDKNKCAPKGFAYLWGLSPPQKAAFLISNLWYSIELKILSPVSAELLLNKITSTLLSPSIFLFNSRSFLTR